MGAAKKPPLSKAHVRERLERAAAEQSFVWLTRWIPDSDRLEGFVVDVGKGWVQLASLRSRCDLDGWFAVRIRDIQSVTITPVEGCYEIKALKASGQWPPAAPPNAVSTITLDVLTTGANCAPVVSVYREFLDPDLCWIGLVQKVDEKTLSLLEVDYDASWGRKVRRLDVDDITRIDFASRYDQVLAQVAGPAPRVRG